MNWICRLGRRLSMLFRRRQFDADLEEEMRLHRELREQDQIERGLSPQEAHYAVQRRFGHDLLLREESREMWGWNWLENLLQDVRYGLRMLAKDPGFTAIATLTLALGIGANTVIFSALDAVLFRPLPYPSPDRMVQIFEMAPEGYVNVVSGGAFLDWRDHQTQLAAIALAGPVVCNLRSDRGADQLAGLEVTHGFLSVLGVVPLRGRGFLPEDDQPGGNNNVVLLTEETWQSRFGGDENLLGRKIILDEIPRKVIGILPAGAWIEGNVEFFVPAVFKPEEGFRYNRENHWAVVYGRTRLGVSAFQAEVELRAIKQHLANAYPDPFRKWSVRVIPLHQVLARDSRPTVLILTAAVALVLLIACANVANLLLARATSCRRELALRAALGASGHRIMRQMLTEGLLLALLGGAVGMALSLGGIGLLRHVTAHLLPWHMAPQVDGRVMAACIAITCGTGLLFSILPAWKARRPDLNEALKNGGQSVAGARRSRSQSLLVVSELALTVVLLTSAGLLLRSLVKVIGLDPGFNPEHALTFDLSLPGRSYPSAESRLTFLRSTLERIKALPGVEAVGSSMASPLSLGGPFSGGDFGEFASREDRPDIRVNTMIRLNYVAGDYLGSMGGRLLRGRALNEADNRPNAAPAILVNEELVRRFFPGEDPLGKHLNIAMGIPGQKCEIVGVIRNLKLSRPDWPVTPAAYAAHAFFPYRICLIVRTRLEPLAVVAPIRREIERLDAGVPLANVRTLQQALAGTLGIRRLVLALIGGFAAGALVLACIGLYGVTAYSVATRNREMSIRLAIGATRGGVIGLVIRDGAKLIGIGLVSGAAAATLVARLLSSELYEVSGHDPLVLGSVVSILGAVALFACWLPARWAAKVDPVVALRCE
jgi:predicted permease